jgi:hypothetical protein
MLMLLPDLEASAELVDIWIHWSPVKSLAGSSNILLFAGTALLSDQILSMAAFLEALIFPNIVNYFLSFEIY